MQKLLYYVKSNETSHKNILGPLGSKYLPLGSLLTPVPGDFHRFADEEEVPEEPYLRSGDSATPTFLFPSTGKKKLR